jgi:hypothetical protein
MRDGHLGMSAAELRMWWGVGGGGERTSRCGPAEATLRSSACFRVCDTFASSAPGCRANAAAVQNDGCKRKSSVDAKRSARTNRSGSCANKAQIGRERQRSAAQRTAAAAAWARASRASPRMRLDVCVHCRGCLVRVHVCASGGVVPSMRTSRIIRAHHSSCTAAISASTSPCAAALSRASSPPRRAYSASRGVVMARLRAVWRDVDRGTCRRPRVVPTTACRAGRPFVSRQSKRRVEGGEEPLVAGC